MLRRGVCPRIWPKTPLKWYPKSDGLRYTELDGSGKNAVQLRQLEWVKSLCPGVRVSRVVVVENKALEDRFAAQFQLLQTLCASTGFRRADFSKDPEKKEMDAQLSRRLRDLPGIRGVGWAFHGTTEPFAWKMCSSGMVNYKSKDAGTLVFASVCFRLCFVRIVTLGCVGYFGSGIYLSFQAEYAAM